MTHSIKLATACAALLLTTACTGDDGTGDSAAGSSSSAADTAQVTTADDGVDDGNGTTSNGTSGGPGGSDDPIADSTGGDTVAGTTAADTAADSTGATGDTGATGATVTGTVFRAMGTLPGIGQDAIGDVYLGLLITCDQTAASVAATVIPDADLSDASVGADYTIEDVPNGTYFLAAFMDDNGNADPRDPTADMGDIAAAMGFGPACTQVDVVDGAAVTGADITLNLVVPF